MKLQMNKSDLIQALQNYLNTVVFQPEREIVVEDLNVSYGKSEPAFEFDYHFKADEKKETPQTLAT